MSGKDYLQERSHAERMEHGRKDCAPGARCGPKALNEKGAEHGARMRMRHARKFIGVKSDG